MKFSTETDYPILLATKFTFVPSGSDDTTLPYVQLLMFPTQE